jgi:hypothetical protein
VSAAAAAGETAMLYCARCREASIATSSGNCMWCGERLTDPAAHGVDACGSCRQPIDWSRGDAGVIVPDGAQCSICYAKRHRGFPFGPWSRRELLMLYVLYVRGERSMSELVEARMCRSSACRSGQGKSYRKPSGAISALSQAWRRNGWPVRKRGESKRLRRARTGPRLRETRKLSEATARALHPLHWEEWRSVNSIAKEYAAELGFTYSALRSQLSRTWEVLGLPRHDRIEMIKRVCTKQALLLRGEGFE